MTARGDGNGGAMNKILAIIALLLLPLPAFAQTGTGLSYGAVAVGTSPVLGTCASGKALYNNSGVVGCETVSPQISISPQSFDAACDGTTNDATALQNWANALAILPGTGEGTCVTNTAITFPTGTNLSIQGTGPGSFVLKYNGSNTTNDIFVFGPSSGNSGNVNLQNVDFETSTSMTAGNLVHIRNLGTSISSLKNIWVGTAGNDYHGLYWDNSACVFRSFWMLGSHDALRLSGTVGAGAFLTNGELINSGVGLRAGGGVGGLNIINVNMGGNATTDMIVDESLISSSNLQIFLGANTILDQVGGGSSSGPALDLVTSGSIVQDEITVNGAWFSPGSGGTSCGIKVESGYQGWLMCRAVILSMPNLVSAIILRRRISLSVVGYSSVIIFMV